MEKNKKHIDEFDECWEYLKENNLPIKFTVEDRRELPVVVILKNAIELIFNNFNSVSVQRAISIYNYLILIADGKNFGSIEIDKISKKIHCNSHRVRNSLKKLKDIELIDLSPTRNTLGQFSGYNFILKNGINTISPNEPMVQNIKKSNLELNKTTTISPNEPLARTRDIYKDINNTNNETFNIDKTILEHWNKFEIVVHSEFNKSWNKSLKKLLACHKLSDILNGISVYASVYKSPDTFFKHKWTLGEFLSRSNGCEVFMYKSLNDYLKVKVPISKSFNLTDPKCRVLMENKYGKN